jgi:hypothetical protein
MQTREDGDDYTDVSRYEPITDEVNKSSTREPMKSSDNDDTRFFTEVHLLAGKLVLVVVIHPLGGSRANWYHMPNP